jgi:hypothetical protein
LRRLISEIPRTKPQARVCGLFYYPFETKPRILLFNPAFLPIRQAQTPKTLLFATLHSGFFTFCAAFCAPCRIRVALAGPLT